MKRLKQQQGVALLIVMMIVALVTIIATQMGTRLQLQIQRTANLKENNQAYWYAMGAEAFARQSLKKLMEETSDKITLNQPWAEEFAYPVDGGTIEARLEDMSSCFNLNAMLGSAQNDRQSQNSDAMDAFHRMLLMAEIQDMTSYDADTLRDSLADWIDEDSQMRPYGAEDSEYESRPSPYLAANGPMTAQSEIRLVNGMKPGWIRKLLPLVCVVPDVTELSINVNTVDESKAALLAGVTGLSMAQAQNIIGSRPADGWESAEDFLQDPAISALDLTETQRGWFKVTTEHFLLHTKARYNEASFSMTSVLQASEAAPAKVLRREFLGVD